jgi:hypothetical protein
VSEKYLTVTIFSMTSCDVHLDERYVPYVSVVNWDEGVLSIRQGPPSATVPGVEHWPLPGAVQQDDGYYVTRYRINNQYGQFGYNSPCIVRFWVEVPNV